MASDADDLVSKTIFTPFCAGECARNHKSETKENSNVLSFKTWV